MSFYGLKPYVSAAERRKKAEKAVARAEKTAGNLSPVVASRGAIAKTFWGKAWCDNLERYSDYANRLPRGRTYVRNGSVIDLKITAGEVQAQVVGSRLYNVAVNVIAVPGKQWQSLSADCAGSIDSLVELLQGRLSKAVMQRICTRNTGLFPAPKEIQFSCSCPDWASMCKHVAAVLYGVGARLDTAPELLFMLRDVDHLELISQAVSSDNLDKALEGTAAAPLAGADLGEVFGIDLDLGDAKPKNGRATAAGAPAPASQLRTIPRHRKTKTVALPANVKKALTAELEAAPSAPKPRHAKPIGKRKNKASVGS
jgi:uncharacterized Zn finger protein